MGIKCYCPNGHKMHVKEFLAGKTGICPKCGARVEIPLQSVASKSWAMTPSSGAEPASQDTPETTIEVQPEVVRPSDASSSQAANAVTASPGAAGSDVLAESPGATWYVHLSSGEQLGPARGDAVREWLAQGRIKPDALVWREGWPQWREAGTVFPQLGAAVVDERRPPSAAPKPAQRRTLPDVEGLPTASTTLVRTRRRTKKEQRAMLSLFLLLLLVIMFGVLLWMVVM